MDKFTDDEIEKMAEWYERNQELPREEALELVRKAVVEGRIHRGPLALYDPPWALWHPTIPEEADRWISEVADDIERSSNVPRAGAEQISRRMLAWEQNGLQGDQ